MEKQAIFVHIPGLTYKSKGPLHIDAIRLDAFAESASTSEALDVYYYISNDGSLTYYKGNVIYRAVCPELENGKVKLTDKDLLTYSQSSPCFSASNLVPSGMLDYKYDYRAPIGRFYDFVKEQTDGIKEHVISVNFLAKNNPTASNLNLLEHDGIFVIEISELNTNLKLQFTFYSRVNDSQSDYQFGSIYNPTEDDFNNSDEQLGELRFAKCGLYITTYNPAKITANTSKYTVLPGDEMYTNIPMYYDISKKDEDFLWEIPVNAELLVTNLQNTDDKINGHYYQYDYDTETKKHVRGDKLKCNKSFDYNDFIYNFYKDKNYIEVKNPINQPGSLLDTEDKENLIEFSVSSVPYKTYLGLTFSEYSKFNYAKQSSHTEIIVGKARCNFGDALSIDFKVSYLNLDTFNYLYKDNPRVRLTNIHESGNHNWVGFVGFRMPYASFPIFGDYTYKDSHHYYGISDVNYIMPYEGGSEWYFTMDPTLYSFGCIWDIATYNNYYLPLNDTELHQSESLVYSAEWESCRQDIINSNTGNFSTSNFSLIYEDYNKNWDGESNAPYLHPEWYNWSGQILINGEEVADILSTDYFEEIEKTFYTYQDDTSELSGQFNNLPFIKVLQNNENTKYKLYDGSDYPRLLATKLKTVKISTNDVTLADWGFAGETYIYEGNCQINGAGRLEDKFPAICSNTIDLLHNKYPYRQSWMTLISPLDNNPVKPIQSSQNGKESVWPEPFGVANYLIPILDKEIPGQNGILATGSVLLNGKSVDFEISPENLIFKITSKFNYFYIPFTFHVLIFESANRITSIDGIHKELLESELNELNKLSYCTPIMAISTPFMIDLNRSQITYSNISDFGVHTMLIDNECAYYDKIPVATNVNISKLTNLLADSSKEVEFEIEYIIDKDKLKKPTDLVSGINKIKEYKSSFCDEQRFAQGDGQGLWLPLKIDKSVTLQSNTLYVLKILHASINLYCTAKIFINHQSMGTLKTRYDMLGIYYKGSDSTFVLTIDELYTHGWKNDNTPPDYIGAIGLYEINLESQDILLLLLKQAVNSINRDNVGITLSNTDDLETTLVTYSNPNSGGVPVNTDLLKYIVFPSVICAKEGVTFCLANSDSYQINTDYRSKTITDITNNIQLVYNFKYLPKKAYYYLQGFYQIPYTANKFTCDSIDVLNDVDIANTNLNTIQIKNFILNA